MDFNHTPVMREESVSMLNIRPGGVYVDCTLGGGGHSKLIAQKLAGGRLIGIDQDRDALEAAAAALSEYKDRATLVRGNFSNIGQTLAELGIDRVEGFLLDLGVSSYQLDNPDRGFSYMRPSNLDMRMDDRNALTAFQVVNTYGEQRLAEIFFNYGEERFAKRVAKAIIKARATKALQTTLELSDLVKSCLPRQSKEGGPHPAKRIFQAIRIEVNQELPILGKALTDMIDLLPTGGRVVAISYHSLEDRIIKQNFKHWEDPCQCPPRLPCVCGAKPKIKILTKKPATPSAGELAVNHRARSAKLRAAEKINA